MAVYIVPMFEKTHLGTAIFVSQEARAISLSCLVSWGGRPIGLGSMIWDAPGKPGSRVHCATVGLLGG